MIVVNSLKLGLFKELYLANSSWHWGSYGSIRTGPYTAIWPEVTWTICYIILFQLISLIIFCFFWDTIYHTKHTGAWIAEWSSSSTCTDHCNLLPMENEFAPALYSYTIGCARLVIKYSYKVGSTLLLYPPIQLRLVVTI
jgi:hypothetical protein